MIGISLILIQKDQLFLINQVSFLVDLYFFSITFTPFSKVSFKGRYCPVVTSACMLSTADISISAYLYLGSSSLRTQRISTLDRYMRTSLMMSRSPPSVISWILLMYFSCTFQGTPLTRPSTIQQPTYFLPSMWIVLVNFQSPKPTQTILLTSGQSTVRWRRMRQSMLQHKFELTPYPQLPLACLCRKFYLTLSQPIVTSSTAKNIPNFMDDLSILIDINQASVNPSPPNQVILAVYKGYVGCLFVESATWIAISEQQQYQEGGVSMYNINGFADFLNVKSEDCSCFGPTQQPDQHFLAKHKTANTTTHPTSPADSHPTQNQDHSLKNGYKKSLKRNTTGQNGSVHMVASQKGFEDSSRWPQEVPLHKWRQEAQAPLYYREITENPRFYAESHEVIAQNRPRFPQINAGHQLQNKMAVHCPTLIAPQHTGMMSPVRVSFGPAMASKIALSPQTAISSKLQPSIPDQTSSITPQVSLLPLEQAKPKQKSKQLQKCLSLQHIYTDYDHQIELLDAQFSKKCEQIPTSPRKTEGHTSKPTEGQRRLVSRMSLNIEIGKSQLLNLKKMDDVQEICSQVGSQESSSSDQSIVVGRLNEYCSMVDQKGESVLGQKSVQSKGAGMTSISSTISHYQFNRRKDQL